MSNKAYGLIHDYYPRERMISIDKGGSLEFFYFPKNLYKIFTKSMTHKSVFIFLEYSDVVKVLHGTDAHEIVQIERILYQSKRGLKVLYSDDDQKELTIDKINSFEYKFFVDFEFTMPEFGIRTKFTPEILQIGGVISDSFDNVVDEYSNYIKTDNEVTFRTKKFLKLDEEELNEAISQEQFYEDYKRIVEIYNPVILTWGGSDLKELNIFYEQHNFKPIKAEYVDLSNLIKRHYGLKEEISLFNALRIFTGTSASQAHHALTDASATKEVFDNFKKIINSGTVVDLKQVIKDLKEKDKQSQNETKEEKSENVAL